MRCRWPPGQLGRIPIRELFEMDEFEQFGDALSDLCLRTLRISDPKATLPYTVMCLKRGVMLEDETRRWRRCGSTGVSRRGRRSARYGIGVSSPAMTRSTRGLAARRSVRAARSVTRIQSRTDTSVSTGVAPRRLTDMTDIDGELVDDGRPATMPE